MMASLPNKLKSDAIAEALFEIRFDSSELSEVVVGRLNDVEEWKDFTSNRLPLGQLPEIIRENDQSVRHQAIIERRHPEDNLSIRIGPHVLSVHFYQPYPGWKAVNEVIQNAATQLFSKIANVTITRLGLRYINLIQSGAHLLKDFNDLELNINLKTGPLKEKLNFAYVEQPSEDTIVQSRIASPEFIGGPNIPADISAAIDVDVYTPTDFVSKDLNQVTTWANTAHNMEKEYFFRLLPDQIIKELRED